MGDVAGLFGGDESAPEPFTLYGESGDRALAFVLCTSQGMISCHLTIVSLAGSNFKMYSIEQVGMLDLQLQHTG